MDWQSTKRLRASATLRGLLQTIPQYADAPPPPSMPMRPSSPQMLILELVGCEMLVVRAPTTFSWCKPPTFHSFSIRGKRAVIVGRSNIVGMPAAMLLNKRDATVTICHSATEDMADIVRQADIVIAAAGQAQLIKASWLKPGAALIDVGTNPVRGGWGGEGEGGGGDETGGGG